MRRLVIGFFAAIGFIVVLTTVILGFAIVHFKPAPTPLAGTILWTDDLTKGLAEGAGDDPVLRLFTGTEPNLRDFLDALDRAGDDPRVKGLFAVLGNDNIGLAAVQQVRDALAAFRAKGKAAIA